MWYISSRVSAFAGISVLLLNVGCGARAAAPGAAAANKPTMSVAATFAQQPIPAFSGTQAFNVLKKQVAWGPRVPGTPPHQEELDYLLAEMKKYASTTVTQKFSYRGIPITNVVGVFYAANHTAPSKHPVLLMAHWDTRPVADGPFSTATTSGPFVFGATGWNRTDPIPGANDGASGVAVLVQLARMFHKQPPPVGVLLLFDDGEDYGDFRANNGKGEGVVLGATYFATHYRQNPILGAPAFGVLLDMIGGKDMRIYPEVNSVQFDPDLNQQVFQIANSLGYGNIFLTNQTQDVDDDHITMNEQGEISTIDLIQPLPGPGSLPGAYKQWHTVNDDVAHCSATSLKAVGSVMAQLIYQQTP